MKTIILSTTAALILVATANAQQRPRVPTYAEVKTCLEKIEVTHEGQTARLTEGRHFTQGPASLDFVGTHVQLARGLLDHPVWGTRAADIEACMQGLSRGDRPKNAAKK